MSRVHELTACLSSYCSSVAATPSALVEFVEDHREVPDLCGEDEFYCTPKGDGNLLRVHVEEVNEESFPRWLKPEEIVEEGDERISADGSKWEKVPLLQVGELAELKQVRRRGPCPEQTAMREIVKLWREAEDGSTSFFYDDDYLLSIGNIINDNFPREV